MNVIPINRNLFRKKTDKGGVIKYMAVINNITVINIQLGGTHGNAISHLDRKLHKDDLEVFMQWPEITQEEFTTAHTAALKRLETNLYNKVTISEKN